MTRSFCSVVILGLSLTVSWATQIQQGADQIDCRLDPPPGYAMPDNAVVSLSNSAGGQVDSAVPSGNGRATFSSLAAGKYSISVTAEGFLPVTQDVEIPSGYLRSTLHVNIQLRPRPEANGAPSKEGERTVGVDSLKVPGEALDELKQAEKAASRKHFDEAIRHAEKAAELYPEYFVAYNNLAVYETQAGRNERAVAHLKKALTLEPDAVGANLNLGRILIDLKRPEEAVLYLQHAAQIDRTASEIQYHLARSLILCSRLPDSIKPLKRALELQPPVEHARFLLAHVYHELGDVTGAVAQLDLYLKTKPKNERELKQTLRTWKAQAKGRH